MMVIRAFEMRKGVNQEILDADDIYKDALSLGQSEIYEYLILNKKVYN